MNCRLSESLFSSYVEDEISQEERRNLESHLMGCRRCSLAMREVRATVSMLARIPEAEVQPSAHFDEDVYARIRSGEGLRPGVAEWIREIFAPIRLKPVFMAGAGVCAMAVAFMISPPGQGFMRQAFTHRSPGAPSVAVRAERSAPKETPVPESGPASEAASPTSTLARVGSPSSGPVAPSRAGSVVASASRSTPAKGDSAMGGRQRYTDEIINDQFYLERGPQGQDPAAVPVNETSGDGVYIIF